MQKLGPEAFIDMVAGDLRNAPDWPAGRRLLLTLTEHGWRIGYQAPEYGDGGWDLLRGPDTWATNAWYPDDETNPAAWNNLEAAAEVALDAYRRIQGRMGDWNLSIVLDPTSRIGR